MNKSRREFLKITAVGTGSLVLGIQLASCGSGEDARSIIRNELARKNRENINAEEEFFPNAFIRITSDNTVHFYIASSEMGQGVMTSLAMLIAEELDIGLDQVHADFAPVHKVYENPSSGKQSTGGSRSIRGFFKPLREAGAVAKEVLLLAAAQKWNVPRVDCFAENGYIVNSQNKERIRYAELIPIANTIPVPDVPHLKSREAFKLIGNSIPRVDTLSKVNGSAVFGMDVNVPGMKIASVIRPPVFGGKVKSFAGSDAKKIKGVIDVFEISAGIAIVAEHFWAVKKAREVVKIQWDEGPNKLLDDSSIRQKFVVALNNQAKTVDNTGGAEKILSTASKTLNAIYETPYLAHACMEPMNCTAHVQAERCDIWAPTQSQQSTQKTGAKITGLSISKVFVHTTFLGGGFGRRSEQDFVADAVEISKIAKAPVKVIWTREDDIRNDYYRPATYNLLSAALSESGDLQAWQHKIAAPSILQRFVPFAKLVLWGKDRTSLSGAMELPYDFPAFRLTYAWVDIPVPVGFWRSVGHSQNAFVTECFLDEIARAAAKDPYQFRRQLLSNKPRHLKVLDTAANKAGWGKPRKKGRFQGIALAESFGSIVAQVAEVSIANNDVRVHRVTAAVDCGLMINPDTVRAQIEGGIVYGLTAALYGEINIADGGVQQSNFHDYPMLRMDRMPEIEVDLTESSDDPGGVGEIGVPPIAPAVANAIFAATGNPVRKLPVKLQNDSPA